MREAVAELHMGREARKADRPIIEAIGVEEGEEEEEVDWQLIGR
jgi:hypothetical protein